MVEACTGWLKKTCYIQLYTFSLISAHGREFKTCCEANRLVEGTFEQSDCAVCSTAWAQLPKPPLRRWELRTLKVAKQPPQDDVRGLGQ